MFSVHTLCTNAHPKTDIHSYDKFSESVRALPVCKEIHFRGTSDADAFLFRLTAHLHIFVNPTLLS